MSVLWRTSERVPLVENRGGNCWRPFEGDEVHSPAGKRSTEEKEKPGRMSARADQARRTVNVLDVVRPTWLCLHLACSAAAPPHLPFRDFLFSSECGVSPVTIPVPYPFLMPPLRSHRHHSSSFAHLILSQCRLHLLTTRSLKDMRIQQSPPSHQFRLCNPLPRLAVTRPWRASRALPLPLCSSDVALLA